MKFSNPSCNVVRIELINKQRDVKEVKSFNPYGNVVKLEQYDKLRDVKEVKFSNPCNNVVKLEYEFDVFELVWISIWNKITLYLLIGDFEKSLNKYYP